jgi:primosomal protein N' (replication factor Y) (superfamily II helicase)
MLAHVLVLARSRGRAAGQPLYTYAIPRALTGRLQPGQLVTVPVGAQLAPGIVWKVDESGAPEDASADLPASQQWREVAALIDATPVMVPHHLALAEWLAERYNCSLATAAHLMLPPGLVRNTRVVLRPVEVEVPADADMPDDATAPESSEGALSDHGAFVADVDHPGRLRDEDALLGALRARGRLDERAVSDTLGARRTQAALSTLLSTGAIAREPVVPDAWVRPRSEAHLRLAASEGAVAAWQAAARAELDRLPRAVSGSRDRAASRSRDERRAERLLRQLAILDVLRRAVDQRPEAQGGRESRTTWQLRDVQRLTRITPAGLAELEAAGLVAIESVATQHDLFAGRAIPPSPPLSLTSAQRTVLDAVLRPDAASESGVVLLHGVTGSGKTEVYLQALAAVLAGGRRGIVLVPEIALTPQAMVRFAGRFPGRVALLHSGLTDTERLDAWQRIRAGRADVVVGSRSALFAPVERLGLIVVDEEHEVAYKQEGRAPTYHARDVAVALGRLVGATVVLGSATPSVESFWEARHRTYHLAELTERVPVAGGVAPGGLPPVTIVDLRAELRSGNTSILGSALQAALAETLAAGQQAVLFLNRRGTATCVVCRECGYVALCGRCDVPMTYHASEAALICHYCGRRQPAPQMCPHCWSASIRYFGLGTERVESAVRRLFPRARVLRWDRDTARTRQAHEELLAAFGERRADVLVGTQMIAKGLDLPGVTLVGVVSADVALFLPDFRASERAFQLLTQVAGRAGRGAVAGRVIVQTFNPDHFCIQAAARHDYQDFYAAEISARERYGYPPFRQFVKFTYTHADRYRAQVEATALAERLERVIRAHELERTDVVGPAPAFMERLRGRYRWHLIVRGPDLRPLLRALAPDDLPRGWSVDVDPASTL